MSAPAPPSYVCPQCGAVSYNRHDIENQYCGRCHRFADEAPVAGVPGYWMNETSGVLAPAVKAYLAGGAMTPGQIAAMRAYLRQWIAGPWMGDAQLAPLRAGIDGLTSRAAIEAWLDRALDAGIDPL